MPVGTLIGIFFGWMVLGPVGAIIGGVIGAIFDRGLKINLNPIPAHHAEKVQQVFFTATFATMGHLAKADGRVSEDEIQAAKDIMRRLSLNENLRKEAIHLFNQGKSEHYNLDSNLDLLWQECRHYPDLLRFFVEIQLEAALADGELRKEERKILLKICERLHVPPREFEELTRRQWASQSFNSWFEEKMHHFQEQQQYYHQQNNYQYQQNANRQQQQRDYHRQARSHHSTLQDAYGVLGVSINATQQEIKKAYRRLMNQHHPDKLVSRGLPEEMLNLAKEKTQKISAAYDVIREAKGFR